MGEIGVFNEEDEDDCRLIKAKLAPKPDSRSGLEPGSGGVWVTGKAVLEQGSG